MGSRSLRKHGGLQSIQSVQSIRLSGGPLAPRRNNHHHGDNDDHTEKNSKCFQMGSNVYWFEFNQSENGSKTYQFRFDQFHKMFVSIDIPSKGCGGPLWKKTFMEASFHGATRTFCAAISWAPTTCWGSQRTEYRMIFSEDFSTIAGGD